MGKETNKIIADKIRNIMHLQAWNPSVQIDGKDSLEPELILTDVQAFDDKVRIIFHGKDSKDTQSSLMQALDTIETAEDDAIKEEVRTYESGKKESFVDIYPDKYDQQALMSGLNNLEEYAKYIRKELLSWREHINTTCSKDATEIDYINKYLSIRLDPQEKMNLAVNYTETEHGGYFSVACDKYHQKYLLKEINKIFSTDVKIQESDFSNYGEAIVNIPVPPHLLFSHIMNSDRTFVERISAVHQGYSAKIH